MRPMYYHVPRLDGLKVMLKVVFRDISLSRRTVGYRYYVHYSLLFLHLIDALPIGIIGINIIQSFMDV